MADRVPIANIKNVEVIELLVNTKISRGLYAYTVHTCLTPNVHCTAYMYDLRGCVSS